MPVDHDSGSPAQQYAGAEAKKKQESKKDINRFVALYASFGIELKIQKDGDGYRNNPGGMVIVLGEDADKRLRVGDGYSSTVYFDKDGKFIEQAFWE